MGTAVLALLSYPPMAWFANTASSEWWGVGAIGALVVSVLVFVIAPIAIVVAVVWFLIAWRRFSTQG
ncbi:hypothetical protein ACFWGN_20975 [Oerskovia sp. NPDC060338]|uniref:hypothetical protein n=1 Tax=Oerskovia sp. NPDC060338 TaxID=3347100 RepID=UPI00366376F4